MASASTVRHGRAPVAMCKVRSLSGAAAGLRPRRAPTAMCKARSSSGAETGPRPRRHRSETGGGRNRPRPGSAGRGNRKEGTDRLRPRGCGRRQSRSGEDGAFVRVAGCPGCRPRRRQCSYFAHGRAGSCPADHAAAPSRPPGASQSGASQPSRAGIAAPAPPRGVRECESRTTRRPSGFRAGGGGGLARSEYATRVVTGPAGHRPGRRRSRGRPTCDPAAPYSSMSY